MKKPILVVMAAGMGSRYGGGGLKQIDPVGKNGEIIMDFSIFDALQAGFSKAVVIIKEEMLEDFKTVIGNRVSKHIPLEYVFQKLDDLPEGFTVPEGRVKPWGTGHAVLTARNNIDAPFVVINADDFYGSEAFRKIGAFLENVEDDEKAHWAMVGYYLKNTLSENGRVARGVCVDDNGILTTVVERTHIEKRENGPAYTEDGGETWHELDENAIVSMNLWGFTPCFMEELERGFKKFLENDVPQKPLTAEYFLPFEVNDQIRAGRADVTVLRSADKWYGVTYKEDKPVVMKALASLMENGTYPDPLWK